MSEVHFKVWFEVGRADVLGPSPAPELDEAEDAHLSLASEVCCDSRVLSEIAGR